MIECRRRGLARRDEKEVSPRPEQDALDQMFGFLWRAIRPHRDEHIGGARLVCRDLAHGVAERVEPAQLDRFLQARQPLPELDLEVVA